MEKAEHADLLCKTEKGKEPKQRILNASSIMI
jgi:hypothetical protein